MGSWYKTSCFRNLEALRRRRDDEREKRFISFWGCDWDYGCRHTAILCKGNVYDLTKPKPSSDYARPRENAEPWESMTQTAVETGSSYCTTTEVDNFNRHYAYQKYSMCSFNCQTYVKALKNFLESCHCYGEINAPANSAKVGGIKVPANAAEAAAKASISACVAIFVALLLF